uniref:Uncharacterized protein n=1 Tax=Anopheles minimus TaxID=112268 RepID=A0A182WN34_9DIPT
MHRLGNRDYLLSYLRAFLIPRYNRYAFLACCRITLNRSRSSSLPIFSSANRKSRLS